MDGLEWNGAAEVAHVNKLSASNSWENIIMNPRSESCSSLMAPNNISSGGYAFLGGKLVDIRPPPEDIFSSIQLDLQRTTTHSSNFNTNSSTTDNFRASESGQSFQQYYSSSNPAPAPAFDLPIHEQVLSSSWNNFSPQQQEEPTKLADENNINNQVPRKSSSGPAETFINHLNGLFFGSPCNGTTYNGRTANKSIIDSCLQEAKAGLIATAGCSTESLDCLLRSASNSSNTADDTNTSLEDDAEISMIFSPDYYNKTSLWPTNNNFPAADHVNSNGTTTVSSGDNSAVNCKNTELLDETASRTTTTTSSAKNSTKRNSKTLFENPSSNTNFRLMISENIQKKPRSEKSCPSSSNISFQQLPCSSPSITGEPDSEAIAQMKEMIYRAAAFRPVDFCTESILMEKPKRKNVRISTDPQTVAARQRRERISERIRVLQRLVPGGSKMDTASMLDEAANYLKFLRSQVKALEALGGVHNNDHIHGHHSLLLNHYGSIPFSHSFPAPAPAVTTSSFPPVNDPNFVYHPKI